MSKFLCTWPDEHFEEKFVSWKVYFFPAFPEFEHKVFRVLTRNFWQGCHNCILHVHRNILRNFIIISKNSWLFRRFRNLCGKCVDSQRKLSATVVKIAFSVAKESFLMKKKFVQKIVTSTFLQFGNVFRFLATKLRKACQNFIVHVQTIILWRSYFVWKAHNLFVLSGIRAKCFQSFDDKFSTGWSQMNSTCAEAQFEEN